MSTPTSVPTTPPSRRRRWWRIALAVLAALILTPMALLSYSYYTTQSAWREAEAAADQLDPRWRLMEIEADRPQIPDQENSALRIIAIVARAPKIDVTMAADYNLHFEKLPPTVQLNVKQIEIIRTELAKIGKPLEETRELKDMPRGRFKVTYTDDFYSSLTADQQSARMLASWLQHDAYQSAQEEKMGDALESCQAILNLGRALEGEPTLIAHLIRVAIQSCSIETLERVLAQGQTSDKSLRIMQAALEQEARESNWLAGVRGERAGAHHFFENIRLGKVPASSSVNTFQAKGGVSFVEWLIDRFPYVVLKYYPEHLHHMNRCVEIAKLPSHERGPRVKEWEADLRDSSNLVIKMWTPALFKIHLAEGRSQAWLRTAQVGIACERYRLMHNAWPATLEALVEKKLLGAVPGDPFDGQPLRYRRTKDGIVIYSIGADGTDNQGTIDRERNYEPGVDFGFRLWDVDRRRQAPQPVAVPLEVEGPQ